MLEAISIDIACIFVCMCAKCSFYCFHHLFNGEGKKKSTTTISALFKLGFVWSSFYLFFFYFIFVASLALSLSFCLLRSLSLCAIHRKNENEHTVKRLVFRYIYTETLINSLIFRFNSQSHFSHSVQSSCQPLWTTTYTFIAHDWSIKI